MELNQYQYEADKTRLTTADENYSLLGFIGEVGELYSLLAKSIRDQKELDEVMIKKELGDCLWFLSALATDFGFTLDDVAETNLNKLQKRQKKGTLTGSGDNR